LLTGLLRTLSLLLLLAPCLRLLRLSLRALPLCGWRRAFPLHILTLFSPALFFISLAALRVRRRHHPHKQ
jgi:hypothetical protein